MSISTSLKVTLSILSILLICHALIVYNVHESISLQYEFIDHRHQESHVEKSPHTRITIAPEHLTSELYLPEALRYPLYTNISAQFESNANVACCEMFSIKGRDPNNIYCEGICNTERACLDEVYPFKSQEEANLYTQPDTTNTKALRANCSFMNRKLSPPYEWCYQWKDVIKQMEVTSNEKKQKQIDLHKLERFNNRNIDPMGAKLPPPGCSKISAGGGSGAYQHLVLFPTVKMAFCGIPKVSITQWLQFLRFTFGAKDYLVSVFVCIDFY